MKSLICLIVAVFLSIGANSFARTLWEDPIDANDTVSIHSTLNGTFLQSTSALQPSDSGNSSIGFGRLRVEPMYRVGDFVFDGAYDNQLIEDNQPVSSLSLLPNTSPVAFRINQVGGTVFKNNDSFDYNELDRLFVTYQKEGTQITFGRQAIGWGRGTSFSAVDIFLPFTPFQFDREWKRGVDAILAEEKISEHVSAELVYAASPDWDGSALGGRFRGAFDKFDYELLVAKRAQDTMWAMTSSAPVAGAEVHAEFAVFDTPGDFPSAEFLGRSNLVPKSVLGVSNNFAVGNGITTSLEYHYSGFGASSAREFNEWIKIPSYQSRITRGDTQIYGNQALALSLGYLFNEKWQAGVENIFSLIDSSGACVPSVTWDFSDNSSFIATAFLPYGAAPSDYQLNSQFGSSAQIFIVQLRLYD